MVHKDCDPRCTGKCNKKRLTPAPTAEKGCDPRCTGRCSKKNASISPFESLPPIVAIAENLPPTTAPVKNEDIGDTKPDGQIALLKPGEIKFVIMDLDGVVLDIETVYQWVIEDLASTYGIPAKDVQHIIDLQDEETAKKLCADYNLTISPQDFMTEFRNTSIKHLANTPLMPAVASTSNEEAFKLKTQKHTAFFRKFSHIVLGGSDPEVDARKPSPKIYQVCGSRFPSNPDPKTVLVLEDTADGVVAARGAQMNAVWFPNKYMNKENNPGALAVLDSIDAFDPKQFGLPSIKR
ncbi:probable pseudouridine-5'-phosphatase isoform X2 [Coccinella septempunctata]|uniref:probable pseudouridine-5'-phosphatase isoform X2 n=1 Tax=Coccinella septempunctata TaxID=41139 RepID=UPI001D094FFE|nr:probable pseudouridine-5'-phosphatase isoform X2 [Coccinella septempunctata]